MLIFILKINPPPTKRRELTGILRSIAGPLSIETGFLACEIYEGSGDDQTVLYMEQWDCLDNMRRHIKSVPYAKLLAAMEISMTQPEVRFFETSQSWGMELIESLRMPQCHKGAS